MADQQILTAAEAAAVLRVAATDPAMLELLPQIDAYIVNATGRDWALDNPIDETAKAAARILLVRWYEDPGMLGNDSAMLGPALGGVLAQLEIKALQLADEEEASGS